MLSQLLRGWRRSTLLKLFPGTPLKSGGICLGGHDRGFNRLRSLMETGPCSPLSSFLSLIRCEDTKNVRVADKTPGTFADVSLIPSLCIHTALFKKGLIQMLQMQIPLSTAPHSHCHFGEREFIWDAAHDTSGRLLVAKNGFLATVKKKGSALQNVTYSTGEW